MRFWAILGALTGLLVAGAGCYGHIGTTKPVLGTEAPGVRVQTDHAHAGPARECAGVWWGFGQVKAPCKYEGGPISDPASALIGVVAKIAGSMFGGNPPPPITISVDREGVTTDGGAGAGN